MYKEDIIQIVIGVGLTIIFIVLKLLKVINWHWILVLAPAWIPFLMFWLGFVIYVIVNKRWKE